MATEITSPIAENAADPKKNDIIDEIKIELNFDRTTTIMPISGDHYYLVLNNCNVYDMEYRIKLEGAIVASGVIAEFQQQKVKIEFKPTVGRRQYVLVNYNDTTHNTCSPTILVLIDKVSD